MQYIFDIEKRDDFWKISAPKISNTTRRQIVPRYLRGYCHQIVSSHTAKIVIQMCWGVSLVVPQKWHLCRNVDVRLSCKICYKLKILTRYPQISLLDKIKCIFNFEKRDDFWKMSAPKILNTARRQIVPSYLRSYCHICLPSFSNSIDNIWRWGVSV
jgi:hypothetical protein